MGFSTLTKLKNQVINLSKFLFNIKKNYLYDICESQFANIANNIILFRLNLKFNLIVMND